MIRFCRIDREALETWLVERERATKNGTYHLRVWREDGTELDGVREELIAYFQEALDDARMRLRAGFEDELSPFNDPALDPAANYPALLHQITLQGYLGETFGALAVEHLEIHDRTDWSVPALLFRFHDVEFQHLERINQRLRQGEPHDPDAVGERRPGRTGDDAIAFVKNDANVITHVLTIEAKCLSSHRADKVTEAHQKLTAGSAVPDSVRELVELLSNYDTAEAQRWQEALIKYRASGGARVARYDAVVYVCGQRPRQDGRDSWLSPQTVNPAYTLARELAGLEFHLEDLDGLVATVYRP
jgi:hypothetical protein